MSKDVRSGPFQQASSFLCLTYTGYPKYLLYPFTCTVCVVLCTDGAYMVIWSKTIQRTSPRIWIVPPITLSVSQGCGLIGLQFPMGLKKLKLQYTYLGANSGSFRGANCFHGIKCQQAAQ